MLSRSTTERSKVDQADTLVAGALPERVQIAHERLAHQDDPALLAALSERELADARALAEEVRDHERNEQRARIAAASAAAKRVRETADALAEREAADLLRAAQAIGEQRHSSSPHAKVARLHKRKPRVLAILSSVVAGSMLFSAVTVQQNIAPGLDVANPMFWLSYGLEALISAVLVALMISTADTAEWDVIDKDKMWQVYAVEGALLVASIGLNTFPYIRAKDPWGFCIHAIAPVMIGVALVTHRLAAERYGRAIEAATAAIPDHDDLQARLASLTHAGAAGNGILDGILASTETEEHAPAGEPAARQLHPDTDTPAPAPGEIAEEQVHPHPKVHPATDVQVHPVQNPDEKTMQVHPEVHPADEVQVHSQRDPETGGVHLHPEDPATPEQPAAKVSLVKPVPGPVHPAVGRDAHRTRSARTGADDSAALAVELVRRGATTKPAEEVAEVLAQAAHGVAVTTIAKNTGIHHKTVGKILSSAEEIRRPRPTVVGGGRVIELDRRSAQ
jgi:hypothetical protein